MSTTLPAKVVEDDDAIVGLEDIDESDLVMPILRIVGPEGVYHDNLTNEKYASFEGIVLGVVKNRILWPPEISGDAKPPPPLCKSLDFHNGLPDTEHFPWDASGFAQADYAEGSSLPCVDCRLKEWGSSPKDDKPWCAEQHTYIILQEMTGGGRAPIILTLARSAIRPSRNYITGFQRARTPMFVCTTKFGLETSKRGSVIFSVPTLARGVPSDAGMGEDERDELFAGFADQYRRIRTFLQTPRKRDEEAEAEPVAVSTPAPTRAPINDIDEEF